MRNKITEEQIKDVYLKFKQYFLANQTIFFNKTQSSTVEDIKEIIYQEDRFIPNYAIEKYIYK
jgi:hypothetical protein